MYESMYECNHFYYASALISFNTTASNGAFLFFFCQLIRVADCLDPHIGRTEVVCFLGAERPIK